MSLFDELTVFYTKSGFGPVVGKRPKTVSVYTGCILVPLPNIETRSKYLKYHDLHHLMTGYSVGRIGEGEVSAWELGTGSFLSSPLLGMMNLIALSTGLFLEPKKMWAAFEQGCRSKNVYSASTRAAIDRDAWASVEQMRHDFLEIRSCYAYRTLRKIEYYGYCSLAVLVHALIAIPASLARIITDVTLGYTFFQIIRPKRRDDLY